MRWPHSPTCTEDCPGHTPTTPYERMVEAARNELHQHGPLNYLLHPTKQWERWQDCPRRDAHEGAGKAIVDAVLRTLPPGVVVDLLAAREVAGREGR